MKIVWLSGCLALCVLAGGGCAGLHKADTHSISNVSAPAAVSVDSGSQDAYGPTEEQRKLMKKYLRFKEKLLRAAGLPSSASWDSLLPHLRERYNLDENQGWRAVLVQPEVEAELTEEKRVEFARVFNLPPTAGWPEIAEAVEETWKRRHLPPPPAGIPISS